MKIDGAVPADAITTMRAELERSALFRAGEGEVDSHYGRRVLERPTSVAPSCAIFFESA